MLPPEVLGEIVNRKALEYGLRPEIVMAIILQESQGAPWAMRWEGGFYNTYIAHRDAISLSGTVPAEKYVNLETEKRLRAHSIGIMQVMGESARSIAKFTNPYLISLCDPEIGIDVGCKVLAYYLRREGQSYPRALASYNAGSATSARGQRYAQEVMDRIDRKEVAQYFRNQTFS